MSASGSALRVPEQENQAAVPATLHAKFIFDHEAILAFQASMSDFMRIAKTPSLREAPSWCPIDNSAAPAARKIDARPVTRTLLVQLR